MIWDEKVPRSYIGCLKMSIVALKRKTNAQYNNMSVSQKAFSLNGTHRSQGYVGQTTLSRSLPRTLMRGNTIRGHGGCCGKYPIGPINKEGTGLGSNALNDPKVVKSSVLDTNGMIMTKYRWIRRPAPQTSVKPDDTLNGNTAGQYIDTLRRTTLADQCSIVKDGSVNNACCPYMKRQYLSFDSMTRVNTVTKPEVTGIDYATYYDRLTQDCAQNDSIPVNRSNLGAPFACGLAK
jgi:hypothetical protein